MNNKAVIFSVVYLCGLAGLLGYSYVDQAQAPEPVLQGTVDARTVRISAKLAGRVSGLSVREGDLVAAGDPVVELNSPELEARLKQAQAAVAAKTAMSQRAERGAIQEVLAQARDQWHQARAAAELAEKTAERLSNLHQDGLVSEQRLDEATTRSESAQLAAEAARQQYVQAQNGTEDELKAAAASETDAAEGALEEVQALMAETHLTSPAAGEVTEVLVHPGEIAPAGFPVVTLTDLSDSWVRFHVREDRLVDFQQGQVIQGYLPALNQTLELAVQYVSPLGEYATWRATRTGEADLRTFEVRARPVAEQPNWRAGMSVVLSLEPSDG